MSATLEMIDIFDVFSPEDVREDVFVMVLDQIHASQSLRDKSEKELKSFMANMNECLGSKTRGSRGLRAMGLLMEQVQDHQFEQGSKHWVQTISNALKSHHADNEVVEAANALATFLTRSPNFAEVSRNMATVATSLVHSLLKCAQSEAVAPKIACMKAINCVLKTYPGSCSGVKGHLETFLASQINMVSALPIELVAETWALSVRLGGSGRDGVNHQENWMKLASKFIEVLFNLASEVVRFASGRPGDQLESPISLPECSAGNVLNRIVFKADQFDRIVKCFCELLQSPFPYRKMFNVHKIFHTLEVLQSMSLSEPASIGEAKAVVGVMPRLWQSSTHLLSVMTAILGFDLLPELASILEHARHILDSSKSEYNSLTSLKAFSALKASVYGLLIQIGDRFGANAGFSITANEFIPLILRDVTPFKQSMVLNDEKSTSKRGKKAYQALYANRSPQVGTSNPDACQAALKLVALIFETSGGMVAPNVHKDVQALIVALALEVQQEQPNFRPFPYSDARCRAELYQTLIALVTNFSLKWSSPIQAAIGILNQGRMGDDHPQVREVCRRGLANVEAIVHPRSAPLHIEARMGLREMSQIKDNLMKIHTVVLIGGEGPTLMEPSASGVDAVETMDDDSDVVEVKEVKKHKMEDFTVPKVQKRSKKNEPAEDTVEDDDEDYNLTADEKKKVMDTFYDFSKPPIHIPEEAMIVQKEKESPKKDKSEVAEANRVDIDQVFANFVAEGSDESE